MMTGSNGFSRCAMCVQASKRIWWQRLGTGSFFPTDKQSTPPAAFLSLTSRSDESRRLENPLTNNKLVTIRTNLWHRCIS